MVYTYTGITLLLGVNYLIGKSVKGERQDIKNCINEKY